MSLFCCVGRPEGIEPSLPVPQTGVIAVIPWSPFLESTTQGCDFSGRYYYRTSAHCKRVAKEGGGVTIARRFTHVSFAHHAQVMELVDMLA